MAKTERLNRYLSRCGLASRRGADKLISEGRVKVDGSTVCRLGTTVEPGKAEVVVDGRPARPRERFRYFMMNKPPGYLCSRGDPFGRPTIYGLLPARLQALKYVGRLDRDTEGLLLLTDDGALIERLTHPRHGLIRTYLAVVDGAMGDHDLAPLRRGVSFGVEAYSPAAARILRSVRGETTVRVEIGEGRKREVRMMFRAIGRKVTSLRRVRFGPVALGELPPGGYRRLSPREESLLKAERPA